MKVVKRPFDLIMHVHRSIGAIEQFSTYGDRRELVNTLFHQIMRDYYYHPDYTASLDLLVTYFDKKLNWKKSKLI